MKKTCYLFVLLVGILYPAIIRASHAQGADLSYKFVSYNAVTDSTQYYVTVTFYRDCSGIPAPNPMVLAINNTSCNGGSYSTTVNLPLINGLPCPFGGVSGASGCEVSHLCGNALSQSTCNGGANYPGMQKYVYADTISLPGNSVSPNHCSQWNIAIDVSARNPSTNLATTGDLFIEAVINNTIDPYTGLPYVNNSPVFQNDPVPFVCLNTSAPLAYNNATVEPDGDSLVYTLVTPLSAHNTPLNFAAGYSVSCPIMSTIPCSMDPATGILNYNPAQTEVDVLAYLVQEYRRGVLVGSTMRDVQIKILSCGESVPVIGNPTVVQGGVAIDTTLVTGCPGGDLIVDVQASVTNSSTLTLQSSIDQFPQLYSGMTFTQIGTGSNITGRIEWTSVDTLCRYVYLKAISDDCPVASTIYRVVKICGNKRISISPSSPVYCGHPVALTASGGTNPIWTPSIGIVGYNTLNAFVSPTVSTWYDLHTDCGNDSVLVRVIPTIASGITHDTSVCNGFPIQLNENITSGSFTYRWMPSIGLYDPVSGLPNNGIANPVFKGNVSGVYHCLATDTSGCVIDDSVKVTVNGAGRLSLTADTLIIAGGQTHLFADISSFHPSSLTVPDSTVYQQSQVQVGTDTLLQGGTAFAYPSPFGNYYKSARHQILFRASELHTLFGGTNVISSLGMDIGILNSVAALANFEIKIGSVQADSLTHYEGGNSLLDVYTDSAYTPVAGWNTFVFQNAYVWDGVSDLVVDICFSSPTTNNINNKMRYTLTPFRSYWWTYGNGYSMCGVTGTQPLAPNRADFFKRPNVRFGLAVSANGVANVQWQPAAGPNAVSNPNAPFTSATPHSNQWYTVTLADSVCPQIDSIRVHVITGPLHMSFDTTICLGDTIFTAAYNAASYSWSDQSGVLSTASSITYAATQSTALVLVMTDTAGHIYTDTSHITVLDQNVWPGDANDDHAVDNNDILYLGIAYGDTGAIRPNASPVWTAQCALHWDSTFASGANVVHADCDGNGVIDYNDTLAVYTNWGFTHAKNDQSRQSNYNITITTDKVFYNRYDTIKATLSVGDNTTPLQNIYGIAYQFGYNSAGSAHIVSIDQSGSWLNRKLDFRKVVAPTTAYIAQSRISHRDTSGYGKIAEIRLVVDGATSLSDSAYLRVGSILALNSKGDTVFINEATKAITVSNAGVGVGTVQEIHGIDIYPNPNNGTFRVIQDETEKVSMILTDAIGREVYSRTLTERATVIDLSSLPDGVYIAGFSSASGRSSKRVIITR